MKEEELSLTGIGTGTGGWVADWLMDAIIMKKKKRMMKDQPPARRHSQCKLDVKNAQRDSNQKPGSKSTNQPTTTCIGWY